MMGIAAGFSIGNHAYNVVAVRTMGTVHLVKHAVMLLLSEFRGNILKHLADYFFIHSLCFAHQLDLPVILYHAYVINDPAVQHIFGICRCHQAQQETGRPVFINTHGPAGTDLFCQNLNGIITVSIPDDLSALCQRSVVGLKGINKKGTCTLSVQTQGKQACTGGNKFTGQIKDSGWIADDHLIHIMLSHAVNNFFNTVRSHYGASKFLLYA